MCNDTSSTVAQHNVEVDDEGYADSSYGDSLQSYTTSLTSSIKNHSYENGRRYHAYQEGKYFAPNDESESDRLDMHHHLSTLMLNGKLHLAPIKKAPRILDIGTGTGIWAIQMGDEYAAAEVIGVDLSPTQPTMIPPNVRFEVDDVEEDWTYSAPFDYIHTRLMAGSIQDWPKLVEQTYKFLKPNGYVEFKDWDTNPISEDDSLPKEGYISQYHTLLFDGMEKMGRDHCPGPKLKKLVEDAGFVDVKEVITPIPIGMWPKDKKLKEIGAWNYITLLEGLEGLSLRLFTSVLGWKIEELQVFLSHVRDELKDKSIHAQYHHHVVVGRKPADDVVN